MSCHTDRDEWVTIRMNRYTLAKLFGGGDPQATSKSLAKSVIDHAANAFEVMRGLAKEGACEPDVIDLFGWHMQAQLEAAKELVCSLEVAENQERAEQAAEVVQ